MTGVAVSGIAESDVAASGIAVSGGADGVAAHADDLLAMAAVLRTTATSLGDAFDDLTSPALRWALVVDHPADTAALEAVQREVVAQSCAVRSVGERVGLLALHLVIAAAAYHDAERGVGSSFLEKLADTVWGGASIVPTTLVASMAGVPERDVSPLFALPRLLAPLVADGSPAVHDLGRDPTTTIPPRSLGDLVLDLSRRNQGSPGEISVSFVTGADGVRRAIVDLPGTKSWSPLPVADVTSVGTDVLAIAGHDSSYERGVFTALADAGVHPRMPVLLVGHSEGGIVAVNAARDAAASGRFRITHVVTAGSPVGELAERLPGGVQLLALENTADIVPELDNVPNPDRPNVTTVRMAQQHGSVGADHDLEQSYLPVAVAAQTSGNPSIDAFVHGASGFLSGDAMSTHAYQITRAP